MRPCFTTSATDLPLTVDVPADEGVGVGVGVGRVSVDVEGIFEVSYLIVFDPLTLDLDQ